MPLRGAGAAVPGGGRRSLGLPVRGVKPLTRRAAGAWGCCGRCLSGGACRARTEGRRDRGDASERSLQSPRLLMFIMQS